MGVWHIWSKSPTERCRYLSEKELEHFILYNGFPDTKLWEDAASNMSLMEAFINIRKEGIYVTRLKKYAGIRICCPGVCQGKKSCCQPGYISAGLPMFGCVAKGNCGRTVRMLQRRSPEATARLAGNLNGITQPSTAF
jgi:hypothetical protein